MGPHKCGTPNFAESDVGCGLLGVPPSGGSPRLLTPGPRKRGTPNKCGYDVKKLMNHYRGRESEREAKGRQLVSFVESARATENACTLHDKPGTKKK